MDIAILFDWIVGLVTLTSLELVLGIDNIILLSILVEPLAQEQRDKARKIGLFLALFFRVMLLSVITYLIHLQEPLFTVFSHSFSLRDIILVLGGMFLLTKATTEIYRFVEKQDNHAPTSINKKNQFAMVVTQVVLFDMVFSLDSVLTAVGLSDKLEVMILAVIIAAILMIIYAKVINDFVQANPALKMLALTFLTMIGVLLVAEGFGSHVDKGYVYFSMTFSLGIEWLNRRRSIKQKLIKRD